MLIINKIKKYKFSFSLGIIILILSLIPFQGPAGSGLLDFPHVDKLIHFILYFTLTLAILHDSGKNLKFSDYAFAVFLSLAFGGMIELIQISQPHRSGDIFDLLANFAGSLTAVPFYLVLRRII